jgi:hypothetical protein
MSVWSEFGAGIVKGILGGGGGGGGGGRTAAVEALCAELGWSVDERSGPGAILLHFRDPAIGVRKVIVSVGECGDIGVVSVLSASQLRQAPGELVGYLLNRNAQMLPAWQMTRSDGGEFTFAVKQGVFLRGMRAAAFRLICETLLKEAHDFDSKLRGAQ